MKRNSECLRKYIMDNRILICGKKIILVSILVLLIGFMTIGKVFAEDRQNGDTNGDGKITVSDISILKAHIVGIKEIESDYRTYADMNGDGKISVTDLSSLKIELVGLGNRALTEQELNQIKAMIEKDNFVFAYNVSINPNNLKLADIIWLTNTAPITDRDNLHEKYGSEYIDNIYFVNTIPSGGGVYAHSLNDIQKMYKVVFDIDISREELINRLENSYHKEIDGVTYQYEMVGYSHFYISESSYNNGVYNINIIWNFEDISDNYIGLLTLKKVEDRFCYISYEVDPGRELTQNEKESIDEYIKQNYDFLAMADCIDGLEGIDLGFYGAYWDWKELITVCSIINNSEINYTNEELNKMYLQLSGASDLEGVSVKGTSFTALKKMFKEIFNIDIDKNYMKNKCREFKENRFQKDIYYVEEKDLVLIIYEGTTVGYKDFELIDCSVQNNIYRLTLEGTYSNDILTGKYTRTLILKRIGDNYYLKAKI